MCWKRSSSAFLRRKGEAGAALQALLFDSWFDPYRGVVVLARVFEGTLRKVGQKIRLWSNGRVFQVEALGVLTPKPVVIDELVAGEVGFIIANIKNVADTKIGDTITDDDRPGHRAVARI
jgi:GTP-binding protein LepA